MKCFPININIDGRKVLVVGGGKIAHRKALSLIAYGAEITLVSPQVLKEITRIKSANVIHRRYRKTDMKGACLVISATSSQEINRRVYEHAVEAGIPVNVVDQPDLCTFIFPAIVSRGEMSIAISTGGASPSLAKHIRRTIEDLIGPEFEEHVRFLRDMRTLVHESPLDTPARAKLLAAFAEPGVRNKLSKHGMKKAKELACRRLKAEVKRHQGR